MDAFSSYLRRPASNGRKRKSTTLREARNRRKNEKANREDKLTSADVIRTPVVDHLVETLYGFPFNNMNGLIADCNTHYLEQEYVGADDVAWALKTSNVLIVKSPMGSGKTTMALDIISQHERVLIISSSRAFSDFMCTIVPGLINYQDVEGSITADRHPRIIIQVQSLRRIKNIQSETTFAQWHMVYLDEPNGCMHQVTSSLLTPGERRKVPAYFRKVMSNIPTVVVTDAGLAQWHVSAIRNHLLSGLYNRPMTCFVNRHAPRTHKIKAFDRCLLSCQTYAKSFIPRLKTVLGKEDSLVMDLECFLMSKHGSAAMDLFVSAVSEAYDANSTSSTGDVCHYLLRVMTSYGENAVVVCSTKNQANLVAEYLGRVVGKDKVVLMTSDTPFDLRSAFMSDPKAYLINKRCLVHTTCISVGVDMNFEWATRTFLIVDTMSYYHTPSVMDMYQAVGRNRCSREVNVFINGRRNYPTDAMLAGGGYDSDHAKLVVGAVSEWADRPGMPSGQEMRPYDDAEKDGLEETVVCIDKLEKTCNKWPRLFFDVFMSLLSETIQKGKLVVREPQNWQTKFKFLSSERDVNGAVDMWRREFNNRIARYTTITLDSFNDTFRGQPKTEKRGVLQDIMDTLHLLSGRFATSFFILKHVNKDLLKQWAVSFKKLQYIEPDDAVDMLNFDQEAAVSIDPDTLVERVMMRLYRNNKEPTLRCFSDFKTAVEATADLMDRPITIHDKGVDTVHRLLVDEFEINTDRNVVMEKVCAVTGLTAFRDSIGGSDNNLRIVMPVRKMKVDIHKMAALLLL